MEHLLAPLLLTGALLASSPLYQDNALPLHSVLTDSELGDYHRKRHYKNRIDLFRKVFHRRADSLKELVKLGDFPEVQKLLLQLRELSRHVVLESSKAGNPKDLRSRQVKKLEIRLRKLIETVEDLESSVSFEYRKDFSLTVGVLENLRGTLLKQIFGDLVSAKAKEPCVSEGGPGLSLTFSATPSATAEPARPPQTRDRFTEKEFVRLQHNQELEKRVEVFLEIAATRLGEIKRRMDKKEWDKGDGNPLEFHTYWDMVHSYERALDGIMINIDEKASYKLASKKDIEKSLKKLNKKLKEFIPQLEPIQRLAEELKDQQLAREIIKARKTSIIAQQGSLYALGEAPDE